MSNNFVPSDPFARAAEIASKRSGHLIALERTRHFNSLLGAARYRLPNGLRLVLMPDPRAGMFAYQTWFKVGSKDESPDRTGMAHLLEHLMFKGTKAQPSGALDREMERRGAETNAATWVDWTFYTQALACRGDHFETVVTFEHDRMVNLALDQESFETELEVVKNERRAAVDNSVAGVLGELLYSTAFASHPYRWPTLGHMSHLESITLKEVRAFYRRFYAPNNAVVVVVGDIDVADTLSVLASHYAPLASQPLPTVALPTEPQQLEARWASIERPVVATQVMLGYHAPAQRHDDFPALEMLHDALTLGESSRLYRRLVVEEALATDVEGYVSPFAEPGLYELSFTLRPGKDPREAVELVQAEIDRLSQGLTPTEHRKAKHNLEMSVLSSLRDAETCAENLGHFEINENDFGLAFECLEPLARVTPADLVRVAGTILQPSNRTVVVAQPPGTTPEERS